jgi:hypothetical protein
MQSAKYARLETPSWGGKMYKIYAAVIKKKLLAYKMALVAKRRGCQLRVNILWRDCNLRNF